MKEPQEHDDFLNYQIKRLLNLGRTGHPPVRGSLWRGENGVAAAPSWI